MIEILFNHLNHNTLKAAQKYGKGKYPGGYSFITYYNEDGSLMTEAEAKKAEKEAELAEAKRWEEATPLGGNPDDVFDLSMNLNIGDISCWETLDKRIDSFGAYIHDQKGYDIKAYEEGTARYVLDDLDSIIGRIKAGEPARIWYGNTAGQVLGFGWLMWNFKTSDVPLERLLVNHADSWEKTNPGDWYKYVDLAVPVTEEIANAAINSWECHMKENAKLRVFEDGAVKAAAKNYYDGLILQEAKELLMADGEFQENWLIGHLHEKEPEIPHYWFYTRIEQMIEEGYFKVIKESDDGWPKSWKVLKITNNC